jgi:hypothetical protein
MFTAMMILVGCSSTYDLQGTVTSGLTGQPLGGFEVLAKADDPTAVALSCRTLMGKVGDGGELSVPGMCSGSSYTLQPKGDVLAPALSTVAAGGPGGPLQVEAFPAPAGDGVYVVGADNTLVAVSSNADQTKEVPLGGTDPIFFPSTTPGRYPVVPPDGWLVLSGPALEHVLAPMVVNPNRLELEGSRPMTPWFYAGVSFDGNTPTAVPAQLDESQVKTVEASGRKVRYIPAGALPAGRYVLYTPGQRRMTLFDMGGEQTLALPSADEGGEADGGGKGKKGKRR